MAERSEIASRAFRARHLAPDFIRRQCSPLACASICALCAALAGTLFRPPRPLLIWNASASSPIGLYAVRSAAHAKPGEMIVAWPPPSARALAEPRHYLAAGVPLVKPVVAAAGDRVCALDAKITVNGRVAATRLRRDRKGRRMSWWRGCRQLHGRELFLLSANAGEAFDGRYFGITAAGEIVGSAIPLWAKPAKGSRHG